MEIPNTVGELLQNADGDFTEPVNLICRLVYDQLTRDPQTPQGLFTETIRRDLWEFGQKVGQDRARELLRIAARQQYYQHLALSQLCGEIVEDLSANEPG